MRTPQDIDLLLWRLLGTGERFPGNKGKKLRCYYNQLMRYRQTGTRPGDKFGSTTQP